MSHQGQWFRDSDAGSDASVNAPQGHMQAPQGQRQIVTGQSYMGSNVPPGEMQIVAGTSTGGMEQGVTRQEAQAAFSEVKGVFAEVTGKHEKIQMDLHALASHVANIKETQSDEKHTLAAAKEALRRTSSVQSEMELQLQSTAAQQAHAHALAEAARAAGDKALIEAEGIKRDQRHVLAVVDQTMTLETTHAKEQAARALSTAAKAAADAQTAAILMPQHEEQIQKLQQELLTIKVGMQDQKNRSHALELKLQSTQERLTEAEQIAQTTKEQNRKLRAKMDTWYTEEQTSDIMQIVAMTASTPLHTGMQSGISIPMPVMTSGFSVPVASPSAGSIPIPVMSGSFVPSELIQPASMEADNDGTNVSDFSFALPHRRNGGNGNGSTQSSFNMTPSMPSPSTSTFNIAIKPRDPPAFHGKATEDVTTWLSKVEDFFHLVGANPQQQVAYTATLLLDAAADWWTGFLKERGGLRPRDFPEMAGLLKMRFQSSTRADRARAELRLVKQGDKESVHAFSCRFSALLQKLPTYDVAWAVSQYIWGLNPRLAELVMMNRPTTLATAMQKANDIEMARQAVQMGNPGTQRPTYQPGQRHFRGRGRHRGGGRAAALWTSGAEQTTSVANVGTQNIAADQCCRCHGYGHWASQCPTPAIRGRRGGRRGRRGGRRGRFITRGQGRTVQAAQVQTESDATGAALQSAPEAPSTSQGNQGN